MRKAKTSKPSNSKPKTAAPKLNKKKVVKAKANKEKTMAPQRVDAHRVDTQAFRTLLNHLDVDWLVRSMEDRDYGIDLQLEIFDGLSPTGVLIFAQLKGTEKSFSEEDSFQFPVKTLLYAELFSTPFFLFRTSISDKKTRFIWLQKFIETKLDDASPQWRTQETVKISMPEDNDLVANPTRFRKMAMDPVRQRQALDFLRIEQNLTSAAGHVLKGQHKQGFFCSSEAKKLNQLKLFIIGSEFSGKKDYDMLCQLYTHFDDIALINGGSNENVKYVKDCLDIIETIKITYLGEPDIHGFTSAKGGVIYY